MIIIKYPTYVIFLEDNSPNYPYANRIVGPKYISKEGWQAYSFYDITDNGEYYINGVREG